MSDQKLVLPSLCVLDLDYCCWHPEMYVLEHIPSINDVVRGPLGERGEGVVAIRSGSHTVRLFPGALEALQRVHRGDYKDMKMAVASSADTPHAARCARACLSLLEVVPGVSVMQTLLAAGGGHTPEGNEYLF